jgi:ABC-type branched-subunit amino acid transport system permease subunit
MEMNWNYIWAAIAINFVLVYIVPRIVKKPTGVGIIDDTVLLLNSQKSFLVSSCIVIAIVVYGAHYWVNSQTATKGPSSPDF